jgi:hypothetical protein
MNEQLLSIASLDLIPDIIVEKFYFLLRVVFNTNNSPHNRFKNMGLDSTSLLVVLGPVTVYLCVMLIQIFINEVPLGFIYLRRCGRSNLKSEEEEMGDFELKMLKHYKATS